MSHGNSTTSIVLTSRCTVSALRWMMLRTFLTMQRIVHWYVFKWSLEELYLLRPQVLLDEFGRGTTADYAACIAEATVFALSHRLRARSLFATHLHDVYDILQDKELSQDNAGDGVAFFCTRMQADSEDEVGSAVSSSCTRLNPKFAEHSALSLPARARHQSRRGSIQGELEKACSSESRADIMHRWRSWLGIHQNCCSGLATCMPDGQKL